MLRHYLSAAVAGVPIPLAANVQKISTPTADEAEIREAAPDNKLPLHILDHALQHEATPRGLGPPTVGSGGDL